MKRNPTLIYILLALGITWLLWIPALLFVSTKGYPLPTINYLLEHQSFQFVNNEHIFMVIIFSLAVYGPLIAGLVASWVEGGRPGIKEWFSPVFRWAVKPHWFGLVLLIALSVVLVPVLTGAILGLVTWRIDYALPSILLIVFLFFYQFLTSGLGEEPGWRGYLLPRWTVQYGQEKAVWWTGLIWALWHFPFTIFYTLNGVQDLSLAAQLSILLPSLIGQTISLIGTTYIYAWLLNHTRSLFLAILFHALGNFFSAIILAPLTVNPIINLAVGAIPWLIVLILDKTDKKAAKQVQ